MWPMVAALAVSTVSSAMSASATAKSSRKQAANQLAAEQYNARTQFSTDLNNIALRDSITQANLANLTAATKLSTQSTNLTTEFNASLLKDVALYNDTLYDVDIANVWAQAGLDTEILANQRARERGSMIAQQGASGTVIGEGSNADAIVDQMSQEAMERFIIKTGAADKASAITNARVQSLYKARQEIAKLEFDGQLKNTVESATSTMKAQSILTDNYLQSTTDMTNALTRFQTGGSAASANYATNNLKIDNNFTTGMFGALNTAAQGAASIYGSQMGSGEDKVPTLQGTPKIKLSN